MLGRMYDGIQYRGFGQAIVEELDTFAGVPVWNGLTDEFHPTQVLADLLTMEEHSLTPLSEVSFCYLVRRSQQHGKLTDGRRSQDGHGCPAVGSPDVLARGGPRRTVQGNRTIHGRSAYADRECGGERLRRELPPHGCVGVEWVNPHRSGRRRIDLLRPYQVNADVMAKTGDPPAKFLHCLPAFHDRETRVGEEMFEKFGLDGMEVTDEVFESGTLDRLRPSGEPGAHHQGGDGGDARGLTR